MFPGGVPALPRRQGSGDPPGPVPRTARGGWVHGEGTRWMSRRLSRRRVHPAGREARRGPASEGRRNVRPPVRSSPAPSTARPTSRAGFAIPQSLREYAHLEREVNGRRKLRPHRDLGRADVCRARCHRRRRNRPGRRDQRLPLTAACSESRAHLSNRIPGPRSEPFDNTTEPGSRVRLQLPGRRGCWPLLRPLSAVADSGRHPGRCLSTGELKTGSAATRFPAKAARRKRGGGVLRISR